MKHIGQIFDLIVDGTGKSLQFLCILYVLLLYIKLYFDEKLVIKKSKALMQGGWEYCPITWSKKDFYINAAIFYGILPFASGTQYLELAFPPHLDE